MTDNIALPEKGAVPKGLEGCLDGVLNRVLGPLWKRPLALIADRETPADMGRTLDFVGQGDREILKGN